MLIYPAIDIRGGRVVRLLHGRFDAETTYGDDPVAQARAFAGAGARWIHVVDLDGAKDGGLRQSALLHAMADVACIQTGGGIRTRTDVSALLEAGVARVVVGSVAVADIAEVRRWLAEFGPERITIALDVGFRGGEPEVLIRGWTRSSGMGLFDALAAYPEGSLRHLLVTDVSRDGAMAGPNLDLMRAIRAARPDIALQASGGVSGPGDLAALRQTGVAGAIVGRAIYEGAIDLAEALAC